MIARRAERHLLLQRPAVHRTLRAAAAADQQARLAVLRRRRGRNAPEHRLRRPAVPGRWRRERPLGRRASARRHPHRPGVHVRRRPRVHRLAAVPARRDVHQLRRVGRVLRPRLAPLRARRSRQPNLDENFGITGFRIPGVAISPYARRGHVSHMTVTHESILKLDLLPLRPGLPEQAAPLRLATSAAPSTGSTRISTRPASRIRRRR